MAEPATYARGAATPQYALRFKNVSGETIPPYAIMSFRTNPVSGILQANKPNASGSALYLVNGARPVAVAKHSEAFLWTVPRRVKIIGAPDAGSLVGPIPGSWGIGRGGGGYRVLYPGPSADTTAVVIATGEAVPKYFGRLDGNLAAASNPATTPSSASFSVWRRTTAGTFEDSGDNITVINRMKNISIVSGAWAEAEMVDGEWRLYVADCG